MSRRKLDRLSVCNGM